MKFICLLVFIIDCVTQEYGASTILNGYHIAMESIIAKTEEL